MVVVMEFGFLSARCSFRGTLRVTSERGDTEEAESGAHASDVDSTDRRRRGSEGTMRRAKAHLWREDRIGGRRLADGFTVGSGEAVFTRRV